MTTLTLSMLAPMTPVLVLSGGAVLLMLVISFVRHHALAFLMSLAVLVGALASSLYVLPANGDVTSLFRVTDTVHFYWALTLLVSLVCVVMSSEYIAGAQTLREEWYLLLLVATAGALVMIASRHMAAVFIGLELMSVPLYGLAAYSLKQRHSLESGIKYLVLSAVASAFLLFGMALLFADTGVLTLDGWAERMAALSPLAVLGAAMLLVGLGFKLSWVPFHAWTPDVYQGAPMPVAAFLATASKVAVVAVMLQMFLTMAVWHQPEFVLLLSLVSGASILLGNLLALRQTSFKRLFAASSIAHFGYLLIAMLAVPGKGEGAVAVYLAAYLMTTLGAFAVLSTLTRLDDDRSGDDVDALRGLYHRSPFRAVLLTLFLLSMAGVPLTAGFIAKLSVVLAAASAGLWPLLAVLVVGSAIGVVYYFRAAMVLYHLPDGRLPELEVRPLAGVLASVLALTVLLIGVWPDVLL